jgi:hypothetical protein
MINRAVKRGCDVIDIWSYSSSIILFKRALEIKRRMRVNMAINCLIFIKAMHSVIEIIILLYVYFQKIAPFNEENPKLSIKIMFNI